MNRIDTNKHPANPLLKESDWANIDRNPLEVKLLSYNLFLRPFVKNVDNDWKDERLEAFVETQLHHFDIMCFQEVFDFFNNTRREKLITYARKAGFLYHSVCESAPIFSSALLDGGILTLSRFPIL